MTTEWKVPGARFLLVGLLLAIGSLPLGASQAISGGTARRVLVLHSYHQGYPFTDNETRGIDEVFRAVSNRVEQYVIYMDAKRVPAADSWPFLAQALKTQYRTVRFDGVLATDNDALTFVVSNRATLPRGVPVVFCGINDFQDSMLGEWSDLTGVVEDSDYEETIGMACRILPRVRRVVAVTDRTTTGLAHEMAVRRLIEARQGRWNLEILSMGDLTLPEFLERLRRLDDGSAVLLLNHYQDRTGRAYSHPEIMGLILETCQAPVFAVNDMRLWPGVVGGKVVSGVVQGRMAAEMLLRRMRGESAGKVSWVRKSPNVWMFDYQGLKRWRIPASALPPGSLVINLPDTFWNRHRNKVVAAATLTLLLSVVIGVLAANTVRRRRSEAALVLSNRRLAALFEGARDAVFIADVETGLILDLNSQAERLMGCSKTELQGQPQSRLHPPDKAAESLKQLKEHARGPGRAPIEAVLLNRAQARVPVEISASVIELAPGRKVIQSSYRDISERRQLTEKLRQAQKMEAVGHLAGGVAHDFNNLLTVILGHVALLEEEPEVAAQAGESLSEIKAAARRATDLTGQLLAFGRRQKMRVAPLNLNQVVENLLRMLRRLIGEPIVIQTRYFPDELWVEADLGMLEQVVTNLALNARDAMPQGGQLVIATTLAEIDTTYVKKNQEAQSGRFACLVFTDTGVGMDTTMVKRIFEPFYTTKEVGRGTGLGLATVYGIIKQHKGWIDVESQRGQGSTFKVFLPLTDKRTARLGSALETSTAPEHPATILVAEDEVAVRSLLINCLRDRGHRVLPAATGPEAVEIWESQKEGIDLLISDMVMPGGMTGYELACKCRADRPNLPVLIVSGYSADTNFIRPPGEPDIRYLPKPFDPQTLAVQLQKCLEPPEAAPRAAGPIRPVPENTYD